MTDPVAVTISALALAVSATTAWLTLFRRGTVKMTQPTVIYVGPDTLPPTWNDAPPPKIYLHTLLFSTSKRGRVIESMHVRVTRNETHQNFNIWVHGDATLVRGSGLFVGETGVAANHHFLTPRDARGFRFSQVRGSSTYGEVIVQDWQAAKLLKPSAIKPVLATLEQALVIKTLGKLSQRDQQTLRETIGKIIG